MTNAKQTTDIGASRTAVASAMLMTLQSPLTTKPEARTEAAGSLESVVGELESLFQANPELERAVEEVSVRNARQTLALAGSTAVPSSEDFKEMLRSGTVGPVSKGGTVVRTFWWGFHVQISKEDLDVVLSAGMTVNTIAMTIGGGIPGPQQPFFLLIGGFIIAAIAALRAMDRGRGIYISMLWWAPGAFVPTPV
jgi:hypothetical protein